MKKISMFFAASMLMIVFALGQNPVEKVIQVTTSVTENPPAISFKWNQVPGNFEILIFRRSKNSTTWGDAIAKLPSKTIEFTDNSVQTGIEYEYAIKAKYGMSIETYLNAGIKCKETEYRGKLILLVDSTFVTELQDELTRYESDLVGDGWEVLRKNIARNASVKYVKSIIRDFYNSDPENVNCIFLFGHIPVPYSGIKAYDGHIIKHDGAWPADMYYGDLNEKLWSDKYENCTTAIRVENQNIPGDGKFDVCILPDKEIISLSVGRVDLYNLPAFPQSEVELLRNYLNKNHAFRHKIIDPKMQSLIDDNFGTLNYTTGIIEAFAISGWRNFSALLNFQNIKTGDFFNDTKDESYIWSYGCGGGTFTSSSGIGTTADFVNKNPKTVFTCLYGSWFGDWDSENNFMRAALASNGWILTCCWAGRPHYTFHQMGMGETIGYCVRATQNNSNNSYYYSGQTNRGIHTSLLGDPALRMHMIHSVNSLTSAVTVNNSVMLTWNQANDTIAGYYIYKLDTLTKKYIRISETPAVETSFEDVSPNEGNNYYMVRTLKLSEVASGSYYNLSQGIFDTIRYEAQTPEIFAHKIYNPQIDNTTPIEPYAEIKLRENILHSNALAGNQWYLNDSIIPGATDSTYLPNVSGNYYVKVTLSNGNSSSSNYIYISENKGETGFTIEALIYPNPSTGLFNISFGSVPVHQATLKIYNLQGKLMRLEDFQETNSGSFDISNLLKGIYIVDGIIDENKMSAKINLE